VYELLRLLFKAGVFFFYHTREPRRHLPHTLWLWKSWKGRGRAPSAGEVEGDADASEVNPEVQKLYSLDCRHSPGSVKVEMIKRVLPGESELRYRD
jgi:hypothetical protein